MQGLLNLFDLYGERFLVVGVSLLSLTFVTLMFLWSYNRRRFMAYKHHIPARVMQGYLDSVIQNSSALKSSLLRGGGSETVPSIPNTSFNFDGLIKGSSESTSGLSSADLAQKNAELASLKSQMSEKDSMISDLEEKMTDLLSKLRESEENGNANQAPVANVAASSSDEATLIQLSEVTKERDLLKEKLKEYEFIESDLAEIPRLQRTVETFKATLKQLGVDPDDALANKPIVAKDPITPEPETPEPQKPVAENLVDEPPVEAVAAAPVAASEVTASEVTEAKDGKKGDDDLLQQFEKMLG